MNGPDDQPFRQERSALLLNTGEAVKASPAAQLKKALADLEQAKAVIESEARFRAFVRASSDVVYRMSPDWRRMLELNGQGFLADAVEPGDIWIDRYIHPDDRAPTTEAIEHAIATKSPFELEHRVVRADGFVGWTLSRAAPIFDEEGEIKEWLGAASDITPRKEAETALRASELRLRRSQAWLAAQDKAFQVAMDGGSLETSLGILITAAVGQADGDLRCTFYLADADGKRMHYVAGAPDDSAHPAEGFEISPEWLAGGWSFPVESTSGGLVGALSMSFSEPHKPTPRDREIAAALTQAATIIISRFRTETVLRGGEERLRLLVGELQHRTRNLLSIVSAIADQSRSTSDTLEDFGLCLDQRLSALGRVQGLLSADLVPSIALGELIAMELDAHGTDAGANPSIILSGAHVVLPADAVQLLALVLHELTTNALKHGALKSKGRLEIRWEVRDEEDGRRRLSLDWLERGVPMNGGEPRQGFGRHLIEVDLPYELDAATRLEFGADGITCSIEVILPAAVV